MFVSLLLSDASGVVGALALFALLAAGLLWWVGSDATKLIRSEGDVIVLARPGSQGQSRLRLAVPWSYVVRVWLIGRHDLWTDLAADVQVELEVGASTHRFTIPVPLFHRQHAGFGSVDPDSAFRRVCDARGVEVRECGSASPDTDPGPISSWASLHEAVRSEPNRYGGVYQGTGRIGVLQVVPGQTALTPGRHNAARVARATGVAAGDLIDDVDVVECRFSRAQLRDVWSEISRLRSHRPDLGITGVEIVDRDNVVEVGLDRLGMLVGSHFDQFGDAVRLVERPAVRAMQTGPRALRWRWIASFIVAVLTISAATLLGAWWFHSAG